MELAKCQWCGTILHSEDIIYQIKLVHGDGQVMWGACCSEACAAKKRDQLVQLHMSRARDMQHQSFQKMQLRDM